MPRIASLVLVASCVVTLPAQSPSPAPSTFQTQLLGTLKRHPFFRDVSMDVESGRPPFLFLVQAPLRRDEEKYVQTVVNPVLPHLQELVRIFDETYCKPTGLRMRAGAEQLAISVLASRGLYDDYARATSDAFLHQSLAHYNHELRLAVTYRAGLGSSDVHEARHSLLHEVVHALQHAYSTTGAMPKPIWLLEGQAEYRASSTNMPETLREPPLIDDHVDVMLSAFAHADVKKLLLPIQELVVPEGYAQVVEAVRRRAGTLVDGKAVLTVFYAQAEMMVRFLHEGEGGKYRDGFVKYFAAAAGGATGLTTFQEAMQLKTPESLAALDAAWQGWLGALFAKRLGLPVDVATGKGLERHAMPPPRDFDHKTLAWQDDEFAARLGGVHRACADGHFDRALEMLPAKANKAEDETQLRRERECLQAMLDLRERVAADLQKRGAVELCGQKGKFVRREGNDVVLASKGGEVRVLLGPRALLEHGARMKAFELAECWKEVWLRWLTGEPRTKFAALLAKDYSRVKDLRAQLTADLDANHGREAMALEGLQRMSMPTTRDAARAALDEVTAQANRSGPLFTRRRAAIETLAAALAERTFDLDDAEALGIHGKLTKLADGRVRIEYLDPAAAPSADFTNWPDAPLPRFEGGKIAYDGPPSVQPDAGKWNVIGDGFLRWAMPIAGPQEIDLEFQVNGRGSSIGFVFCVAPGRYLEATASGGLVIYDQTTGISDTAGKSNYTIDTPHTLAIRHDGAKTVTVSVDGKQTAKLGKVGNCTGGQFVLAVRSSTPILLRKLVITGKLDPSDPTAIRKRHVERVIAGLWQPSAAPTAEAKNAPVAAEPRPSPRQKRMKSLDPSIVPVVEAALRWLVLHQSDDGRWDADGFMARDREGTPCTGPGNPLHDVGVSALALLALAAAGNTAHSGRDAEAYRRGVEWLARQQNMDTGCLVQMGDRCIYDHALGTLALVEAAAYAGERWRVPAQAAVDYLEQHRSPYGVWHYAPRDGDGSTPLTIWCTEANAAAIAAGLRVNEAAPKNAAVWFDSVAEPNGHHGYQKQGETSSRDANRIQQYPAQAPTLAAGALFARLLLGQSPKTHPVIDAAAARVSEVLPTWEPKKGTIDECYLYFGSHALWLRGGAAWTAWQKRLAEIATANQRRDGNFAGSWDPDGAWSHEGGRVFVTAMMALGLLAPTRYERRG